jgi:hypothetical protein
VPAFAIDDGVGQCCARVEALTRVDAIPDGIPGGATHYVHSACDVGGIDFEALSGKNKKKAGRLLEDRTWDEMPRVATSESPRDVRRLGVVMRARLG